MRICFVVTLSALLLTRATASAQFVAPLPPPFAADRVGNRLLQVEFLKEVIQRDGDRSDAVARRNRFREARGRLCDTHASEVAQTAQGAEKAKRSCEELLSDAVVEQLDRPNSEIASSEKVLAFHVPLTHPGYQVAHYLRRSSGTSGLQVLSQFAASVSDKEAFVVSNVIRGLAGRALVGIDYAAVITKADDESSQAKREEIEGDKSTLIRMVNNGGTLVGRAYAPFYAVAGQTISSAAGLNVGAGIIGNVGQVETVRAAGTGVVEMVNSVAIRSLTDAALQGEVIIGGRVGYALSDGPLLQGGGSKRVGFGQLAVGLRQNNAISLSVLVTQVPARYREYVPRMQVNFSAIR